MPLFPIREIMWQTVEEWEPVDQLRNAPEGATVAVISPSNANMDDNPQLFIPVQPVDTLKDRIKTELNRALDSNVASDRSAFKAMMVHLDMSEMCRYPEGHPQIGETEKEELRAMFQQGDIKANGLYIVARGYPPALMDDYVVDLGSNRFALGWSN